MSDDPVAAGLLRAILTNPADDAPRLIYADWLDEHGHDRRARFIRDQIRHPFVSERDGGWVYRHVGSTRGRWPVLCETPVWEFDFGRVTVPSAVAVENGGVSSVGWDRGFVSRLRIPTAEWTKKKITAAFARHPITSVWFTFRVPSAQEQLDMIARGRKLAGLPPL
jgi:uncharacterized protein (TIGR02996 family)